MVMSQRRYAVWQNKLQQKVEAEAQAKAAQEAEAAHAEAAAQQAEAAAQAEAAQSLLLLREQEPWAPQEHDSLFARQDFLSLDVLPVQHEKSFRLNVGQHPEDVFAAVERDFLDEFEASFAAVERDFGGVEQADGGVDHAATNYRDGLNQAGQDERDQLYTALSEFTARNNIGGTFFPTDIVPRGEFPREEKQVFAPPARSSSPSEGYGMPQSQEFLHVPPTEFCPQAYGGIQRARNYSHQPAGEHNYTEQARNYSHQPAGEHARNYSQVGVGEEHARNYSHQGVGGEQQAGDWGRMNNKPANQQDDWGTADFGVEQFAGRDPPSCGN